MTLILKGGGLHGGTGFLSSARLAVAAVPALVRTWRNRRAALHVSELPDYLLSDLGLRRDDVLAALNADWREDATYRLAIAASKRRRGL